MGPTRQADHAPLPVPPLSFGQGVLLVGFESFFLTTRDPDDRALGRF
jgi:hypothetical protein